MKRYILILLFLVSCGVKTPLTGQIRISLFYNITVDDLTKLTLLINYIIEHILIKDLHN